MQIFYSERLDQIGIATELMECGFGPCANIDYYDGPFDVVKVYVVFTRNWVHGWELIGEL